MTFIAGLRTDGLTAPYVIDGAMDGQGNRAKRFVTKG
jgi:hypothetical protein